MGSEYKSGFIAIIGRPNVGKSTLMNKLIGEKISIISNKPQTTRNNIRTILTTDEYQLIFIDTPGMHKPKNMLGEYMLNMAEHTMKEVDVIIFITDVSQKMGPGDSFIMDKLKGLKVPVLLLLNKIDLVSVIIAEERERQFMEYYDFNEVINLSALKSDKFPELIEKLVNYIPEGPKLYPDDMLTDQTERVLVSEIIREKALELLEQEIPHGIAVEIDSFKDRENKDIIDINANIYCEKKSHKGIIIGKNGGMLREIGSKSRVDIESLLGSKVFLQLWVKVSEQWREKGERLRNFGYK